MQRSRGISLVSLVGTIALVLILAAGGYALLRPKIPSLTTPYQAVLLNNGSVYFGKLENLGSPYPVLTDVYYVQSSVDQNTKQVSNILVKRGKEWHSPDRMLINSQDIVFIEPVTPGSKVAQLIAESKR